MYELVVVWETGETNIYGGIHDLIEGNKKGRGMVKAFGRQISYWCVRPERGNR